MRHPSYLELDRLALGDGEAAVRAHVEACPRCGAHLDRLRTVEAVPAWARALEKPRRRFGWLHALALAGAATATVSIGAVLVRAPPPPPYVAAKGMPSVALYVQRGTATSLWNGTDPLRPGDRIRLKVAPEGHRWLAVSQIRTDGSLALLHEARVAADEDYLLPESWRLDDAPGPERLHVALDDEKVDPAQAAWTTTLELHKEPSR